MPRARDSRGNWVRAEARALEGLRATIFDDLPDPDVEAARAREAEEAARAALAALQGKQLRLGGIVDDQLDFGDIDGGDDDVEADDDE